MLDSMVSAPVTKSIPFFGELTPEDYDSLLRDTLAQVIAQTCASIPPEG
jgi:hypothetical protein